MTQQQQNRHLRTDVSRSHRGETLSYNVLGTMFIRAGLSKYLGSLIIVKMLLSGLYDSLFVNTDFI